MTSVSGEYTLRHSFLDTLQFNKQIAAEICFSLQDSAAAAADDGESCRGNNS